MIIEYPAAFIAFNLLAHFVKKLVEMVSHSCIHVFMYTIYMNVCSFESFKFLSALLEVMLR